MAESFVSKSRLDYFWKKVKTYLSTNYAAKTHSHATTDVTGLSDALAAKADATAPTITGPVTLKTSGDAGNTVTIAVPNGGTEGVLTVDDKTLATTDNIPTKTSQLTNDSGFLTSHQDLSAYAPLASPTFTGTPAAPTAEAGTSTTQLATTEFVTTALNNFAGGTSLANKVDVESGTANNLTVSGTLTVKNTDGSSSMVISPTTDGSASATSGGGTLLFPYIGSGTTETVATLSDLPTKTSDLTNDSGYLTEHQDISGKVSKTGDTMTGTLTFDNGSTDDNKTMAIQAAAGGQDVAVGTIGGISVPANGSGKTFATTDDVNAKANAADAALTGTPTAPTASTGTNTTQIATTAFVQAAVTAAIAGVSQMGFEVVESLPETGDPTKIYLVKHTHTESGSTDAQGKSDSYDEYAWITSLSAYEKIGNTDLDIQVITEAEIDAIVV